MLILITYDVETSSEGGQKRLRKVARICENYGQRVQQSVFECSLDSAQLVSVRNMLLKEIDKRKDSLRLYKIGNNWEGKIEHYGIKQSYNPEGVLII